MATVNELIDSTGTIDVVFDLEDTEARDAIQEEAEYRREGDAVLNARMDTFTYLPDGSTSGDAELADARVGYDGTVYANAGAAVRGQAQNLDDQISDLNSQLLADRIIVVIPEFVKRYVGYSISSTGVLGVNAPYDVLLFKVAKTEKVTVSNGSIYSFYDVVPVENKTTSIDNSRNIINLNNTNIDVPTNAIYIGIRVDSQQTTSVTKFKTSIIEELNKDIIEIGVKHDDSTNFIDLNNLFPNRYINGTTGEEVYFNGLYVTDFIEFEESKKYHCNNYVQGTYYAFYDKYKTFISGYGDTQVNIATQGYFDVPANAKYGRFTLTSFENAQKASISINDGFPKKYSLGTSLKSLYNYPTEYTGGDISVFNKILCIGDSLTYGGFNNNQTADLTQISAKYCYPTHLRKITGVDVNNVSRSGVTSVDWYTVFGNTDLSGHDCCIIQLGVNDVYKLNGWTNEVEIAYSNIIAKVQNENKNIKIFVASTIHGQSFSGQNFETYNASLKEFVESFNDSNVVFLNIYKYGHLMESTGFNAGHLSAYGYWRLAKDYANYISWYLNNNRSDFRWIQFIGTEYHYDV